MCVCVCALKFSSITIKGLHLLIKCFLLYYSQITNCYMQKKNYTCLFN